MKINLVTDNPKSWFNAKVHDLKKRIQVLGHSCQILDNHAKIKPKSDLSFFLSCEKYITSETRGKSLHSIVVHESKLPNGKGWSPTTWQILSGKNIIPITLFEVADKIDAGEVYLRDSFKLDGSELIEEWHEKLYQAKAKMIINFIKNFKKLKSRKQIGKTTYYNRRTPQNSELDVNKSLAEQFNLLRIADNDRYPAYFHYKKHKYTIKISRDF